MQLAFLGEQYYTQIKYKKLYQEQYYKNKREQKISCSLTNKIAGITDQLFYGECKNKCTAFTQFTLGPKLSLVTVNNFMRNIKAYP